MAKKSIERQVKKMGWVEETMVSIKSFQLRPALHQIIAFGLAVASVIIMWKVLMCITGSEGPVVIVISESMEPGFQRGDVLFVRMSQDPIRVGEIVIYNIEGGDIPTVHRVIKVHEKKDTGEIDILTKGDNNVDDDIVLYAPGQLWLHRHHIMGRAVGFLPYAGWATLILTEIPIVKCIVIGAIGLYAITSNDYKNE